jgi:hypothetical protein
MHIYEKFQHVLGIFRENRARSCELEQMNVELRERA